MKVKQTGFLNKEELQTEDLLSLPVLFSQSVSAAFFWEGQGDLREAAEEPPRLCLEKENRMWQSQEILDPRLGRFPSGQLRWDKNG